MRGPLKGASPIILSTTPSISDVSRTIEHLVLNGHPVTASDKVDRVPNGKKSLTVEL